MSISSGPNIIKDGLILCLDASNPKSCGPIRVEVLVVGGGGGGGMDMGGGGGGGGVIYDQSYSIAVGTSIAVTVAAGGWGAPAAGSYRGDSVGPQPSAHQYTIPATAGGNSSFGDITAYGGGFGGSSVNGYTPGYAGGTGASGGGGSGYSGTAGTGGGTATQGFRGGHSGGSYYSGGGGGAGAAGADGPSVPHGGAGVLNAILGPGYYWGGGGGGAAYSASPGGNGGIGGGGGGAIGTTTGGAGYNNGSAGGGGAPASWANCPGGNAGSNTGGGGGGGSHYNATNQGGNGGSGIVIVRYRGAQKATGGTVTSFGGYTLHTFTSPGSTNFVTGTNFADLSNQGNHHTITAAPTFSTGKFTLDGSTQGFTKASALAGATTLCTVVIWYSTSDTTELWVRGNQNNGWYLSASASNNYYHASCGTPTNYVDLAVCTRPDTPINYRNGAYHMWEAKNVDFSAWTYFEWFLYPGGWQMAGSAATILVYNRALSAEESRKNLNALRGRYGL